MSQPTALLNDGKTRVPLLGFGTWLGLGHTQEDKDKVAEATYSAIKTGYRHIDTAWIYGIEDKVGQAVKRAITEGLVKREELFIVTKVWITKLKGDKVIASLNESLHRMGLDYVDCLLIHFPCPVKDEPESIKEGDFFPRNSDGSIACYEELDIFTETWGVMEQLVRDGKTRSIGVSNFNSKQIEKLFSVSKIKPVMNQVESHPYLSQEKLKEVCDKHGIIMTAYSAFGGNPVPSHNGPKETNVKVSLWDNDVIKRIADKHKKKVNHVLLRYQIDRGVAVIPKSVDPKRVVDNFNIFDFKLDAEDMKALSSLNKNERMNGDFLKGCKNYPFDED
jgi:aldehyde reductase